MEFVSLGLAIDGKYSMFHVESGMMVIKFEFFLINMVSFGY